MWLLIIITAGVLAYIAWQKFAPPKPKPVAVATPVPETPVPATPEPIVAKATPTPTPIAFATPTPAPIPTPPSLDLATVVRSPTLWPPQVVLAAAVSLPVMMDGRVVGSATVPAGTTVRLLRIINQQAEIQFQNARHLVPIASTDLMTRALAIFRDHGSTVPQAPSTPAVAAATPQATPGSVPVEKLNIGVTADRKRVDMERATVVAMGEESKSSEKVVYDLNVQSRSRTAAPSLDVQYVVFVERQKLGRKKDSDTVERVTGSAKTNPLSVGSPSQSVTTNEIELWKRNLTGGYIYTGGGRLKVEDNILGIWVRVSKEGQLVAEYINPPTLSKRGWEEK